MLVLAGGGGVGAARVFIVSLGVFLHPRNGDSLSGRSGESANDLLNIKSLDLDSREELPRAHSKTFTRVMNDALKPFNRIKICYWEICYGQGVVIFLKIFDIF